MSKAGAAGCHECRRHPGIVINPGNRCDLNIQEYVNINLNLNTFGGFF